MNKQEVLLGSAFGQRVAEEETNQLSSYFVETDYWTRILRGDIDVVYGPKGAGKSALYSLLIFNTDHLFDRGIFLVPAENPRGAPAFRNIAADPPASEKEFINLWKLYFVVLLHGVLIEFEVKNASVDELTNSLQREGLVRGKLSLARILSAVQAYVKRTIAPQSVEGGLVIDPATQMPAGFTGKITFGETSREIESAGYRSVDTLIELTQDALSEANLSAWILLDRLDVAFVDSEELEANALRALFRTYLDLMAYDKIKLKIFLRSDIWRRIMKEGFREASHITKHVTIQWNRNSLLNLIVRRLLHNRSLREHYDVEESLARASSEEQERFFYRVFPEQVEVGQRKSTTLDWLLSHTRDASLLNAPRELIHMLNSLRDVELRRLEIGEFEAEHKAIFSRGSFKEALVEVSTVRLEQTFYAENPSLKTWVEKLRGEKTSQTAVTLAKIWSIGESTAQYLAQEMAEAGLFEVTGSREDPSYKVPFLYRDALQLVQGTAD